MLARCWDSVVVQGAISLFHVMSYPNGNDGIGSADSWSGGLTGVFVSSKRLVNAICQC